MSLTRRIGRLIACLPCLPSMMVAEGPAWPVPDGEPSLPGGWRPVVQATASGEPESALFGCVRNNGNRFHEGLDIAPVRERRRGEATDPVEAIYDGVVTHINAVSGNSSYGRYVVLEHPGLDLQVFSLYAHLAKIENSLAVGKVVKKGEPLGLMGRSAGGYTIPRERAHLHLEIGLRLSEDFDEWYDRQAYTSGNHHGNFNGINLIGLDPLAYFESFQRGRVASPLEFVESIPPAVMVHVYSKREPDFLQRYPELVIPGCAPEEQAGWEVILSAWGLPLSVKPLSAPELQGVREPGDISVVGVNRQALDRYECRDIISERGGKVSLGRGGQVILEILFMP